MTASYWIDVSVHKIGILGKSGILALMPTVDVWRASEASAKEMTVKSLSRKTSKLKYMYVRTANRHRCAARVEQGEQVRVLQGTRQKSGRTFGIRPALC